MGMWACPIPSGEHDQHRTPTHIHNTSTPLHTHTHQPVTHVRSALDGTPSDVPCCSYGDHACGDAAASSAPGQTLGTASSASSTVAAGVHLAVSSAKKAAQSALLYSAPNLTW